MNAVKPQEVIEVNALRVGMFIHLDGGWMSHPFPLSNFKLAAPDQIATLRALGLQRVRWSPHLSELTAEPVAPTAAPAPAEAATPEQLAAAADAAARAEKARRLAQQRAAQSLCEKQFAEAARECKKLTELIPVQPKEAAAQAEALSRTLLSKMLGDQEICIRMLNDVAGDKAAAHALNVTVISMLMGRTFNLGEAEMLDLGVGAMLHDLGKREVPERFRHREEHFTSPELRAYEDHVTQGVSLARKMGLSLGATLVVAQHHEHADGSGFPLRLNADRMTPQARIVALVNRYDNLCNPHVLSRAMTPHESLSLLFAQGKSKFDTAILGAFIKMMGVYPPGSTVQLTDDRYAMVVAVNSTRPLKPRVLVHEARVPRDDALVLDLEKFNGLGIRRSVRPAQLPPESLAYLSPRPRVAYFFENAVDPADLAEAIA